uniref:Uncharacterized protein n=1 Tax=Anopheles minimus TaxID=112268 RepID=A0A182WK68_9DIPT
MERFSISILCQQVYNICRLCGVDNPDKIPIIGAEDEIFIADSEEPTLAKKIEQCVGIKVDLMDQMPQQICSLCVDKVNDFFEYRSMCEAINIQTRRFLSLPLEQPPVSTPQPEPIIKQEIVVVELDDDDDEVVDTKPNDKPGPRTTRNRKKQPDTEQSNNNEEAENKPVLEGPSEKRLRYDFPCMYCFESYSQNIELDRHLIVKHTPLVHKFGCGSCMEYFDTASEFKDHNLWHKLTRTSFGCFRCSKKFAKIGTLNKHVAVNGCIRRPPLPYEVTLVPDMQCTLCHKMFKTRNLYEWHACFMRTRANCPKCGKYFLKKNLLIRHYMLYCNGTKPLLEPVVIPKDEPYSGPVNDVPTGGTDRRKRGRPRVASAMKEETIDLPFPPLLDLPDLKSESNSMPDGNVTSDAAVSGTEMEETTKRSSLIEETDKITTLLRSGESVDGNTDINTINSMLSSVNEAIATISKVRKKKKKRDRLSSSGAGKPDEVTEQSNPPMVVLSMANVKQEVHEDSEMACMENGLSEPAPANVGNSLAGRNDNGVDSDSDVEIISVEQYQPINSGTNPPAANWNDAIGQQNTRSHETEIASEPVEPIEQMMQVKREPLAIEEDESDFEGYEDASMFVAVKQEPLDETVQPISLEQSPTPAEKQSEPSLSSYQALRIKIKKEKGLLNASVVGEDASADPISTAEENSENNKRQTRADGRVKKTSKKSAKRHNNPPPVKRCLRASTMGVSIKQEPMEAEEQQQETVTEPEQNSPPEENELFDSTVRIKQEPQEEDPRPATGDDDDPMHPSDEVAFDGRRIKRERPDDDLPTSHKRHASSNDSSRKAINPLSLTGVRIVGGKKSANNQPSVSANKSSVMINPFALLKQKENVPTVAEQESTAKDSESSAERSERFGLPVITQVQSIDPVEHLSLALEDTTGAVDSTNEALQQQGETTVAMDCADNVRHTDSEPVPSTEPGSSESLAAVTSNVPSPENGGGLMIASVTTISEGSVSQQENNSELNIASVSMVTEERASAPENSSELKIASVTTIPAERVTPQDHSNQLKNPSVTTVPEERVSAPENSNELKIASVTTLPEERVSPSQKSSELRIASVTTIPEERVTPQDHSSELKIASFPTIPEERLPVQENSSELKIASVPTIPEERIPSPQKSNELRIPSVTTIPEERIHSPQNNSELKIASVTTIPENLGQGCPSEEPYNEQQMSANDADKGDIALADASELHGTEDLTLEQQVTKNTETSASSAPEVNKPLATVVSPENDKQRAVDDDEHRTLHNEEENEPVSVASESSEGLLEEKPEASRNEEQQISNNHDKDSAETSDNIEKVTETGGTIQDEKDNIASCSEESEECSVEEVRTEPQKGLCTIANNDAVLVAKQ